MAGQTSIASASTRIAGMLSEGDNPVVRRSKIVETAAILPGYAVCAGSGATGVIAGASSSLAPLGIVIRDQFKSSLNTTASETGAYQVAEVVPIVTFGAIQCSVNGTGAVGAALSVIAATGQLSTVSSNGTTHIATTCTLLEAQGTSNAVVNVNVMIGSNFTLTQTTNAASIQDHAVSASDPAQYDTLVLSGSNVWTPGKITHASLTLFTLPFLACTPAEGYVLKVVDDGGTLKYTFTAA